MNTGSCIQTIELLRRLALNVHGVIDVVDDRNCDEIISLLKEQEAVEPKVSSTEQRCGNCNKVIEMDGWKSCPWCGKPIAWSEWWSKNADRR